MPQLLPGLHALPAHVSLLPGSAVAWGMGGGGGAVSEPLQLLQLGAASSGGLAT